ncbi:MAG: DUF1624 domain-containing protein [Clostridium sp.]|nr:DUF1624 domain-containing protein [Clostridium sp.]
MGIIFTKEPVNRKRQVELDIAKAIAIIFMVWVHVNEYYQSELYEGGMYHRVVEFLGSPPAAPIFMMLLGIGIVYSRNSQPHTLAIRGAKLFMGGYILSFIRDWIPYLFLYHMNGNDKEYLVDGSYELWGVDILQFAGLTMLFFAVVKKLRVSNRGLFVIWSIFSALHMVLRGITFDSHLENAFFGLFWGTDSYSWFPFLNWITFPLVGYVFGQYLICCVNKNLFYKRIFVIAGSVSIPLWIYSWVNDVQFGAFGDMWQDAYYHHDMIGSAVLIAFALGWLSVIYFITPYLPKSVVNVASRWSKNTNGIYSYSYILMGYGLLILGEEGFSPIVVVVLSIVIFIASDLCCIMKDKLKMKYKTKKEKIMQTEIADYFNVEIES